MLRSPWPGEEVDGVLLSPGDREDGSEQLLLREFAGAYRGAETCSRCCEEQQWSADHAKLTRSGRFQFRIDEPVGEPVARMSGELPQVAFRRPLVVQAILIRRNDEPGHVHIRRERSQRLHRLRSYLELARRGEVPGCVSRRGDDVQHDHDCQRSGGTAKADPGETAPATGDCTDKVAHRTGGSERQQHACSDECRYGERAEFGSPHDEEQPPRARRCLQAPQAAGSSLAAVPRPPLPDDGRPFTAIAGTPGSAWSGRGRAR